MARTRTKFKLFDAEFFVRVQDHENYRSIKVSVRTSDNKRAREIHGELVSVATWNPFKPNELPPLSEHVASVLSVAIQKWIEQKSDKRDFEEKVKDAVNSTAEIWRQQFEGEFP